MSRTYNKPLVPTRNGEAPLLAAQRQALSFDEVMLPLPADQFPSYVFIKRGDQIHRLAKYDPWVLRKLLLEAGLSLYPGLSGVERRCSE